MNLQENEFKGQIVVGLRLGKNSVNILRVAEGLGTRMGTKLKIIHVLERIPVYGYSYPNALGAYEMGAAVFEEQALAFDEAERKLKDVTAQSSSDVIRDAKVVLSSDVSTALLAESHNASLLIIGVDEHKYGFIPKGLSVVLSVLGAARIPVMLIRSDAELDFKQRPSIAIADDVAPSTIDAINSALKFALACGARAVTHAHFLSPTMEKIAERASRGRTEKSPEYEDFLTRSKRGIDIILKSRVQYFTEALQDAACSYQTYVGAGAVADEIEKLLAGETHDVIVFGRSPLSHFKPFALGRLAVNSLFMGAKAALIVPPQS